MTRHEMLGCRTRSGANDAPSTQVYELLWTVNLKLKHNNNMQTTINIFNMYNYEWWTVNLKKEWKESKSKSLKRDAD